MSPRKGKHKSDCVKSPGSEASHQVKLEGSKSLGRRVRTLYTGRVTDRPGYWAIAWSLKDGKDRVLTEQSRYLGKVSAYEASCTALLEGLTAARDAGVKILHVCCDSLRLVNQVSGAWKSLARKQTKRLRGILERREQFDLFSIELATSNQNVYTVSLAHEVIRKKRQEVNLKATPREANVIASQHTSGTSSNTDECPICVEQVLAADVFKVKGCSHWFCVSCVTRHVEDRVKSNQVPVKCPQECSNLIELDECRTILPPELLEAYAQRLTEACIPEWERIYCPFKDCSSFMSKPPPLPEGIIIPGELVVASAECMECHRLFCTECLVPWHADMTCQQYKRLPPGERDADDVKLKTLASGNKWQQCKKCRLMIELAYGCNHITCRCGHEFCYICGASWANKRATCRCALWDEAQLLRSYPHYRPAAPVQRHGPR
ncbi:hypothetical protein R1sor_019799 [Riccia sorocarpa]|uniref:RBR-type E3 ubiquitin transferase n=1 Tax=Riccia sorocarpa TaxID=122646 RepID=A0ABD3IDP3_9MARC